MSAKFELEAMRISLGEMLARVNRIEKEICGECREAASDGQTVVLPSAVCVSPSDAAVSYYESTVLDARRELLKNGFVNL